MAQHPSHRDEILEQVDSAKARTYVRVREILDAFEQVAPWDVFYQPSPDLDEMIQIHQRLVEVVEEIPQRAAFRHLERALSTLVIDLPLSVMDQITKEIFLRLLDRHSDEAHTPRTREVAKETLDQLPDDRVDPSIKELLKFLIDRNAGLQITDEVLNEAIDGLPNQLLPEGEKQITKDLQYYFRSIHEQIESDLAKIKPKLSDLAESVELFGTTSLQQQQRLYTLGADLKGKCVSSLMGAAAGLIAEGRWSGPEIEPILFPEKLEETERNEQLAIALEELMQSIRTLPEKIPLRDLIVAWKANQFVDRYALTPLYQFLSGLGDVIKAQNRRAIYLADYYELRRRENVLIKLVNELNELNQRSWESTQDERPEIFRRMIRGTLEMAAVLDVELLESLIGENNVRNLSKVVELQQRRLQRDGSLTASEHLLEKVPERLRTLVPLLHDNDLRTFLATLQSAVLKRATFALRPPEPPAPIPDPEPAAESSEAEILAPLQLDELDPVPEIAPDLDPDMTILPTIDEEPPPAPPEPAPPPPELSLSAPEEDVLEDVLSLEDLPTDGPTSIPDLLPTPVTEEFNLLEATEDLDLTFGSQMILAAMEDQNEPQLDVEKRETLELLNQLLEEILSPSNSGRKAFLLVHRMLSHKRMVPLPMLRSVAPYLDDLMNLLVPQIMAASQFCEIPPAFENLTRFCQEILQSSPATPEQIEQVGADMNRVDRMLHGLQSLSKELLAELPEA